MHRLSTRMCFLVCSFYLFSSATLAAQSAADTPVSLFESLHHTDALEISIETNQRKLIKEKKKENYQPATLSYSDQDGQVISYPIEVKTRGNMRLKTCYYPPLRIKLSEETIKSKNLKNYAKLKLVVGCKGGDTYEQMLLREYLAYRVNSLITDRSFKVQLLKLTMKDTEGKVKDRTSYAFAIEDQDELAARLGGILYEPKSVSRRALEKESYDILSIFQYLIGNTDWFVLNQHNTKYIRTEDPPAILPIAYDFDFAGVVNAPYAIPNEKMPITSVQERYFIGDCREDSGYGEIIKKVKERKDAILSFVQDFEHMNERSRDYALKYLTKSFEYLEDEQMMDREIKRGCGWTPMDR